MGLTDEQVHTCNWIGFSFGMVSLICSLITLGLIYKMDKNNGYLRLIASTTVFQILYDINYIVGIDYSYDACLAWHFLDILGGLSVAMWTNIVSFIILYVVANIQSVDIFRNFKYFLFISTVPPLVLAVLAVSVSGVLEEKNDEGSEKCGYGTSDLAEFISNIYYWGRLLSILANYAVFLFISWRLRLMAIVAPDTTSSKESISAGPNGTVMAGAPKYKDHQSRAIYALVSRMKYYPLVQALCRSGAAWNEFDGYRYSSFPSFVTASVCSPSTGACYFIVFLIMQPNALKLFLSYFPSWCTGATLGRSSEDGSGTGGDSTDGLAFAGAADSMYSMDEAALESIINEQAAATAEGAIDSGRGSPSPGRWGPSISRPYNARSYIPGDGGGSSSLSSQASPDGGGTEGAHTDSPSQSATTGRGSAIYGVNISNSVGGAADGSGNVLSALHTTRPSGGFRGDSLGSFNSSDNSNM